MNTLPESIAQLLSGQAPARDTIGLSGAGVYLYPDRVLKLQPDTPESRTEYTMLAWLQGKLPVPRVLAREVQDGTDYLLMTRLPGKMACDETYMRQPARQQRLLAQTLQQLWAVDTAGCPAEQHLEKKLTAAARRVEQGLVDMDDTMPGTFGPGGFRDPEALLIWLWEHRPPEEPALSHGDLCLPNVFFLGDRLSGLIDFPRGGIGDRWNDIALCHRSLGCNFGGRYGRSYPGYDPLELFRILDIHPDWDRIRYYILLDELF